MCTGQGSQDSILGRERRTVLTGSVMISAVIEQMYWSGTATSLASDGPAASLPLPSLPPAIARSNAVTSASAAAAASTAASAAASARCEVSRRCRARGPASVYGTSTRTLNLPRHVEVPH